MQEVFSTLFRILQASMYLVLLALTTLTSVRKPGTTKGIGVLDQRKIRQLMSRLSSCPVLIISSS